MNLTQKAIKMLQAQDPAALDTSEVHDDLMVACGENPQLQLEAMDRGCWAAVRNAISSLRSAAEAQGRRESGTGGCRYPVQPGKSGSVAASGPRKPTQGQRRGNQLPRLTDRYHGLLGFPLDTRGYDTIKLADATYPRLKAEAQARREMARSYSRKAAWLEAIAERLRGTQHQVADVFTSRDLRALEEAVEAEAA